MDQQFITRLTNARRAFAVLQQTNRASEAAFEAELNKLLAQCDHRYADGETAIVQGLMLPHCAICNKTNP